MSFHPSTHCDEMLPSEAKRRLPKASRLRASRLAAPKKLVGGKGDGVDVVQHLQAPQVAQGNLGPRILKKGSD